MLLIKEEHFLRLCFCSITAAHIHFCQDEKNSSFIIAGTQRCDREKFSIIGYFSIIVSKVNTAWFQRDCILPKLYVVHIIL